MIKSIAHPGLALSDVTNLVTTQMNFFGIAEQLMGLLLPLVPYIAFATIFGMRNWRRVLAYGSLSCCVLVVISIYVPFYLQGYSHSGAVLGRDAPWGIPVLPIIGNATYIYTIPTFSVLLSSLIMASALFGQLRHNKWVIFAHLTGSVLFLSHYLANVKYFQAAFSVLE